jgi:hypothetical protein
MPHLFADGGGPDPAGDPLSPGGIYEVSFASRSIYYPQELPAEAIAKKAKEGHIDRKLWVPLEDLRTG